MEDNIEDGLQVYLTVFCITCYVYGQNVFEELFSWFLIFFVSIVAAAVTAYFVTLILFFIFVLVYSTFSLWLC